MSAAAVKVAEAVSSNLGIYATIILVTGVKNDYNRKFKNLASINTGAANEFIVKGSDFIYRSMNTDLSYLLM